MGLPCWFTDSLLPLQGVQVQSLVRELRSHMPQGTAKQTKTRKLLKKVFGDNRSSPGRQERERGIRQRDLCGQRHSGRKKKVESKEQWVNASGWNIAGYCKDLHAMPRSFVPGLCFRRTAMLATQSGEALKTEAERPLDYDTTHEKPRRQQ